MIGIRLSSIKLPTTTRPWSECPFSRMEIVFSNRNKQFKIMSFSTMILYLPQTVCFTNDLIAKHIPNMVFDEDNLMISNLHSFDEVKMIVFSLSGNNTLGPNRFGDHFYRIYWDIISKDAFNLTLNFLSKIGFSWVSIPMLLLLFLKFSPLTGLTNTCLLLWQTFNSR